MNNKEDDIVVVEPTVRRPSSVYKNLPDVLLVGIQCVVPKKRILGMFNTKISRVKYLADKMKSENKIVDVSGTTAVKTLILLDNGFGVLSGFTVRSLAQHCGPTGITGTNG